jgi:hypothetical protein
MLLRPGGGSVAPWLALLLPCWHLGGKVTRAEAGEGVKERAVVVKGVDVKSSKGAKQEAMVLEGVVIKESKATTMTTSTAM